MFEQLSIFTEHLFSYMKLHVSQIRRQEFPEGVRRVAYLSSRGAITAEGPRSPGVFGAKSCNLAPFKLSETDFPKLIFEDFHQIVHQLGL